MDLGIGVLMILMIISIVILVLQFSLVRMNQVRIEQDAFRGNETESDGGKSRDSVGA